MALDGDDLVLVTSPPGALVANLGSTSFKFKLLDMNSGGRELARSDIKSLLYLLIDVVIQFGVEHHERFIKEIWYDPERKRH